MTNAPTKHQVIKGPDGEPLFAVVPWEEYKERFLADASDDEISIPWEVAKLTMDGKSLVWAWRKYRGMTQAQVAEALDVSRQTYLQMESTGTKPRPDSLRKLAAVFGCEWEQLRD